MCMYGKCRWENKMIAILLEQLENLPDDAAIFIENAEAGEKNGQNQELLEDDENPE